MQAIVAQVTTTARRRTLPTHVVLEPGEGGITQRSWVLCHELATLDDADLAERPWGPMIPHRKLIQVERALMSALDIPFEA